MSHGPDTLTLTEAGAALGVSSPDTVASWLSGGHFQDAHQVGDEWRIPRGAVDAVKQRLAQLREANRLGVSALPDADDGSPLPLL